MKDLVAKVVGGIIFFPLMFFPRASSGEVTIICLLSLAFWATLIVFSFGALLGWGLAAHMH
jgi:hypothetical protein